MQQGSQKNRKFSIPTPLSLIKLNYTSDLLRTGTPARSIKSGRSTSSRISNSSRQSIKSSKELQTLKDKKDQKEKIPKLEEGLLSPIKKSQNNIFSRKSSPRPPSVTSRPGSQRKLSLGNLPMGYARAHSITSTNQALVSRIEKIMHRKSLHEFPVISIQSRNKYFKSYEERKKIELENRLLQERINKHKNSVKSKKQLIQGFKEYESLKGKLRKFGGTSFY